MMTDTRCAVIAALLLLGACGPSPAPGPEPAERAQAVRGAIGDTVWVVTYDVKPDKRAQYERFLHTAFWPVGERLGQTDPVIRRVFGQTRMLHPTRANPDGTFTYAFLMDPVVPGGEYSILALLQKGYGEAEGERIFREQFLDALADQSAEVREWVQGSD
jgi:hypothetical protein